jgi:hypothetical protein
MLLTLSSRPLAFLDAPRPPVEADCGTHQVRADLQGNAARALRVFEILDGGDMAVG